MANPDPDELLDRDKQKVKRAVKRGGVKRPSMATVIEGVMWTVTAATGVAMVGIMPWIGPEGILTGEQWLGIFLPLIGLVGGGALFVRKLPTEG